MTNDETFIIRSSIKSKLLQKKLLRGTIFGGIGINFLLLAAIFVPMQEMEIWGPFFFIAGLGLITWGLFPYKRLKHLEEKPFRLKIDDKANLCFFSGEKILCTVSVSAISHFNYVEKGEKYGIAMFLKEADSKKVIIQDSCFNFLEFFERPRKQYGCDLFFPYFSRRSSEALRTGIQDLSYYL